MRCKQPIISGERGTKRHTGRRRERGKEGRREGGGEIGRVAGTGNRHRDLEIAWMS